MNRAKSVTLRCRKRRSKYHYFLDIYDCGQRWQISINIKLSKDYTSKGVRFTNPNERLLFETAERIAAETLVKLLMGEFTPQINMGDKNDNLLDFIPDSKNKQASSHFKTFCDTQKLTKLPFSKVTKKFVQSFYDYLMQCLEISSANYYFFYIAKIYNDFRIYLEQPENDVFSITKQTSIFKEKEALTIEEIQIISNLEPLNLGDSLAIDAFVFACNTGLRRSDLLVLQWTNIINNCIRIVPQKTRKKIGKILTIPLNENALQILEKYKGKEGFIFEIDLESYSYRVKKLAKAAGINKNITTHTARHTFASLVGENTGDIFITSKLLGHTNTQTTQIYTHASEQKKKIAVNSIPSINSKKE